MKQLRNLSIAILSSLCLFNINSCKKTDDSTLQLPPSSSLNMDFNFTNYTKSASATQSQLNHAIAAGTVLIWSAIAATQTDIPSASFKKALENKPVYNGIDKIWEWSYVTSIGDDKYNSKLTGNVVGDSVQWKMYLSKVNDNNLTNYLWFEGKSNQGRTGGWWILNYPRADGGVIVSEQGLKISWSFTSDQIFSLKYLYIANKKYDKDSKTYVNNDDKGGYIEFRRTTDQVYDAYYTIYSLKELKKYEIVWNIKNKNGQYTPGDKTKLCWDENLADQTCN